MSLSVLEEPESNVLTLGDDFDRSVWMSEVKAAVGREISLWAWGGLSLAVSLIASAAAWIWLS